MKTWTRFDGEPVPFRSPKRRRDPLRLRRIVSKHFNAWLRKVRREFVRKQGSGGFWDIYSNLNGLTVVPVSPRRFEDFYHLVMLRSYTHLREITLPGGPFALEITDAIDFDCPGCGAHCSVSFEHSAVLHLTPMCPLYRRTEADEFLRIAHREMAKRLPS